VRYHLGCCGIDNRNIKMDFIGMTRTRLNWMVVASYGRGECSGSIIDSCNGNCQLLKAICVIQVIG
jgi:hypothetical protein